MVITRITEAEYQALITGRAVKDVKPSKYRNVKKEVNGMLFDSTKEANRYMDLFAWQQSGQITELERQKEFRVVIQGIYIGSYFADFVYYKGDKFVVEDVKSRATKTDLYKWKKKCVEAVFGVTVIEI